MQNDATVGSAASPGGLNDLTTAVQRLSADEQTLLGELIKKMGGPEPLPLDTGPSGLTIAKAVSALDAFLREQIEALPYVWQQVGSSLADHLSGFVSQQTVTSLLLVVLILLIAGALEAVVVYALRQRLQSTETGTIAPDKWGRPKQLMSRALVEIGGVSTFGLAGLILARSGMVEDSGVAAFVSFLLFVIVGPRLIWALLRFAFAPHRSDLRVISIGDHDAKLLAYLFWGLFSLVSLALYINSILQLQGSAAIAPFRFWLSVFFYGGLIGILITCRRQITGAILADADAGEVGLRRMAEAWPWITAAVMLLNWLAVQVGLSLKAEVIPALNSLLVIVLVFIAPFLDTVARGIVFIAFAGATPEGSSEEAEEGQRTPTDDVLSKPTQSTSTVSLPQQVALEQTRNSYLRISRVALIGFVVFAIAKLWRVEFTNLAKSSIGIGAAGLFGTVVIAVVGYILWELCTLYISRLIAIEGAGNVTADLTSGGGEHVGGSGGSRLATILPILRAFVQITIIVMTVMLALSNLGVDITALVAGAGVIGIAIGFGAQTLVKDVVSGFFFLLDDAFRVGEFIDAGGTLGTVEKISLRSVVLRSVNGPIHIVPYGEISKITNSSRDWVIMKLRFTVPFETDLEKVRKIFKKIGQEIAQIPELTNDIIEPFKSQGAAEIDDVGIVVRGKFMAKPGRQFQIRKEIYSRVQQAFMEAGIDFARKEVRVQMPGFQEGARITGEQAKTAGAAVVEAVEPKGESSTEKQSGADDR